jgi:glycosyltransferase involved in cell wall biosynthesis
MAPTISVVIPCYNHARFLAQAVESVLAQTVPVQEIVVVDDGSTDGSGSLIDSLAAKHPGLIHALHQANSGPAQTRQRAVEKATGDWVLPLDADDYLHPTAVERMIGYALGHPEFVVIYTDYYRVDENNKVISEYRVRERRDDPLEGKILNTLVRQSSVTATALIRRAKLLEVGGYYSEETAHKGRGHEDYFVYLKLALKDYAFGYIPEPLFYYRVTTGSVSSRAGAFYQNRLAVLKAVYKIDSDRMVEAEDYATFKRVDQLEDAFLTIATRDSQIASLQAQLDQAHAALRQNQIAVPPAVALQGTGPNGAAVRMDDVRAQLDELRRIKASKFYWLVYRVIDPALGKIRGLWRRP